MIGQTISHYKVLSALGSGGMGVVYEAEDLRLGRRVAIKMLPDGLERGPEVTARFLREARSASALNHPNICTIYEIEEHDGQQFIVMELLVGQTLANKIGNHPLKTELILEYGIQIADALDAAHREHIIHRDIKASNIFITERGQAKVLDFGLAKLEAKAAVGASTLSVPSDATKPGTTLGTLLYMSPEQARGEEVDARGDIFSFGVVLYEIATGTLPFQGSSQAVIFNQILASQPTPPLRLNPRISPRLEEVILKALEKDLTLRYQSAAELRADLKRLRRDSESAQTIPAAAAHKARRWISYAAAVVVGLLATLGIWRPWNRTSTPPASSEWVQLTNFADSVTQPALSGDGRMLAFIRGSDTFVTRGQIWVKLLPNGEPKQLTHDDLMKMGPAFTPDGSQIVYTVVDAKFGWNTFVVPVLGGEPQQLLPNAAGLTWTGEHQVLFSEIKSGINMAVVSSDESRMHERDIYVPPSARGMAHRSALAPDRGNVLLAEMDNDGWQPCRIVPAAGVDRGRQVGPPRCTNVAWSPDGKWMYFSGDAGNGFHLWRQRFPNGEPQQITFGPTEQEGIAIERSGASLVTSAGNEEKTLWLHDEHGDRQVSSEGFAVDPQFSPDGSQLFFLTLNYTVAVQGFISGELNVANLQTGQITRVTPGVQMSGYTLSPDGREVAFAAYDSAHHPHLWLAPVDRSSPPRQLFSEEGDTPLFAPGGVIYYRSHTQNQNLLFRYKPDGTREKINCPPVHELMAISPDGKWVSAWSWNGIDRNGSTYAAINTQDGHTVEICDNCGLYWSSDARTVAFISDVFSTGDEKTYFVPLKPGQDLPKLPPHGVRTIPELMALKAKTIDAPAVPAPRGEGYVFARHEHHRNLYRIPLR